MPGPTIHHHHPLVPALNTAACAAGLAAWRANTAANRAVWAAAPTVADLVAARGAFAGLPCVVCAPGPSLDDALPDLARLRDRVAVVALDAALLPLLEAGVAPDFIFSRGLDARTAPLLADAANLPAAAILPACVDPAALAAAPARRFFYMPAGGPGLEELARSTGLPTLPLKPSGGAMALLFAAALGFDTLFLAGFDYALTGGRSYAAAVHPAAGAAPPEADGPFAAPVAATDLFRDATVTTRALHASAEDLSRVIRLDLAARVVNASGGILFNLDWLPLGLAVEGVSAAAAAFRDKAFGSGDPGLDRMNEATANLLNPLIVRNCLANRGRAKRHGTVADLFARRGEYARRPVVVAGAAASLDDLLPALARHRERYLLMAVDASAAPLLDAGLVPDLVMSVDPEPSIARFFDGIDTSRSTLVASVATHPAVLDLWRGPIRLGWCPSPSRHVMAVATLFPDLPAFMPQANCGSTAVHFAFAMGAREVILAGVDFAFTGDRWYARGVRGHGEGLVGREALLSALGPEARERVDARGDRVLTEPRFEIYARLLESHFAGSGFRGIRNAGAGLCTRIPRVELDAFFAGRAAAPAQGDPA